MLVSWWASELAAGKNQPLANLPVHWYLAAFPLLTVLTKILRFAQDDGGSSLRMTVGGGKKSRQHRSWDGPLRHRPINLKNLSPLQ